MRSCGFLLAAAVSLAAITVGANLSNPRKLLAGDVKNMVRADYNRAEDKPELTQYLIRVHQQKGQAKQILQQLQALSPGQVRYIPHDTFSLVLLSSEIEKVRIINGVEDVYEMPASMKMRPASRRKSTPPHVPTLVGLSEAELEEVHNMKMFEKVSVDADLSITKKEAERFQIKVEGWAKAMRKELKQLGCSIDEVGWSSSRRIFVLVDRECAPSVTQWLAQKKVVHFAGERPELFLKNRWAGNIIQSGNASNSLLADQGLDGSGQIIGCADSGIDYDSCFFSDPNVPVTTCMGNGIVPGCANMNHRKIVSYRTCDGAKEGDDRDVGHGTHVVGTIAGDAKNLDIGEYNGIAPAAKIVFDDVGFEIFKMGLGLMVPADVYEELFPHSYSLGAKIHSNSWGAIANEYDLMSSDIDKFSYENDDFLVLFAAGNSGPEFGTLGAPAGAKNILSIGAGENDVQTYPGQYQDSVDFNNLVYFSSRGPTPDGRFKPDVVCPGDNIASAESDGNLNSNQCSSGVASSIDTLSGTSMATPGCAGGAALVRQYFEQGFFEPTRTLGFSPTGALVKAVMLHSGHPMWYTVNGARFFPAKLPHESQGYGRVDLSTVLWFGDESLFTLKYYNRETVQMGESPGYSFDVTSGSQFKVTLVWMDVEGSPAQSNTKVLIQDLDLIVESPSGALTLGNHLDGKVADHANNNEQVTIGSAEPGVYTVKILPHELPVGPQNYALVVTGDKDMVEIPYQEPACTLECSNQGKCKNGQCVCDIGFDGEDCSKAFQYLPNGVCSVPVLGSPFSGHLEPPPMSSPSGKMSVGFKTDATLSYSGFVGLYKASGTTLYSNNCNANRADMEITQEKVGVIGTGGAYASDTSCIWGLGPQGAKSVTIFLQELDLEWNYDFLSIEACEDKNCRRKSHVNGSPFTGRSQMLQTVVASTPYVLITLQSDASVSGSGFKLTFAGSSAINKCTKNRLRTLEDSIGIITDDVTQPYQDNLACGWVIDAGEGQSAELEFLQFSSELHYDNMEIKYLARTNNDDCTGLPVP